MKHSSEVSTLALKPKADVIRSSEQEYQYPPKTDVIQKLQFFRWVHSWTRSREGLGHVEAAGEWFSRQPVRARAGVSSWPVHVRSTRVITCRETTVYYRPRSEASEGYVFTGVCHFKSGRGGTTPPNSRPWPGSKVITPPPPPPLRTGRRYASYWNVFLLNGPLYGLMVRFHCPTQIPTPIPVELTKASLGLIPMMIPMQSYYEN